MANKANHIQAINTANLTRSRQKYIRGKTRSVSLQRQLQNYIK